MADEETGGYGVGDEDTGGYGVGDEDTGREVMRILAGR